MINEIQDLLINITFAIITIVLSLSYIFIPIIWFFKKFIEGKLSSTEKEFWLLIGSVILWLLLNLGGVITILEFIK